MSGVTVFVYPRDAPTPSGNAVTTVTDGSGRYSITFNSLMLIADLVVSVQTEKSGYESADYYNGPGDVNTPERILQHDRLLRDNNWRVGGGVSYSLSRLDVFGSYIEYVSGTDSHAGRAFTAGISWPFELGGAP